MCPGSAAKLWPQFAFQEYVLSHGATEKTRVRPAAIVSVGVGERQMTMVSVRTALARTPAAPIGAVGRDGLETTTASAWDGKLAMLQGVQEPSAERGVRRTGLPSGVSNRTSAVAKSTS